MTGRRTPTHRKDGHKARPRAGAFQERRLSEDGNEIVQIFGLHAVSAALANPARKISKLMMTENAQRRLADAISARGLSPQIISPKALDRALGSDTVHQGILLETLALSAPSLEDLAEAAHHGGPIVILDQVTDPHNVGAVLRSSAVFGASGLIMTRRNSPALSGVLAKSASGALELVPVYLAGNLSRTIAKLKDLGITVAGLDGEAELAIEDMSFENPCALVLGAEGKGLRQLTRDTCSQLVRIETPGSLASLNVSNAAAVALHTAAVARRG